MNSEEKLMRLLSIAEYVVEDTGEGFEFVKVVATEGKLRFVLKREEPGT